jgi:hypothetical protein
MPKVKRVLNYDGQEYGYQFKCPGCKFLHIFRTHNSKGENRPIWTFNGNLEKPTFIPSLKLHYDAQEGRPGYCCHSIVTDGKIQFCSDCTHDLVNQTMELPEDV